MTVFGERTRELVPLRDAPSSCRSPATRPSRAPPARRRRGRPPPPATPRWVRSLHAEPPRSTAAVASGRATASVGHRTAASPGEANSRPVPTQAAPWHDRFHHSGAVAPAMPLPRRRSSVAGRRDDRIRVSRCRRSHHRPADRAQLCTDAELGGGHQPNGEGGRRRRIEQSARRGRRLLGDLPADVRLRSVVKTLFRTGFFRVAHRPGRELLVTGATQAPPFMDRILAVDKRGQMTGGRRGLA